MNSTIASRLEYFAQRCDQLLNETRMTRPRSPTLGEDIAKDVITGGLADLASEYFGTASLRRPVRKYAKKLFDSQGKAQQENLETQREINLNFLLGEVKNYVGTLSSETKNLTGAGNSSTLVARIDACRKS